MPEAIWDDHDDPYMDAEYNLCRIDEDQLPPSWLSYGCVIIYHIAPMGSLLLLPFPNLKVGIILLS